MVIRTLWLLIILLLLEFTNTLNFKDFLRCVSTTWIQFSQWQEEGSGYMYALELDLHVDVSHHVGDRNQTSRAKAVSTLEHWAIFPGFYYFLKLHLLICVCVCATTLVVALLSYHIALGDWTQVARPGSKCLQLPSHLTSWAKLS
jgi:hypothetical protein